MHETCKSCGTVFEVDESNLTNNIKWLRCGVCNKKWILSLNIKENLVEKKSEIKDTTEKVKKELASIKSVVEDKTKSLAKKTNPVLDQKNKTVAEIASELSMSKVNENNKNKTNNKKIKKFNLLPILTILLCLVFALIVFFRSTLIAYSIFYFPYYSQIYTEKINSLFTKINLPILTEVNNLNLINFIAKVQQKEVRFTGTIKNITSRPLLLPRIKILGVREDRKIILEEILILEDKIIFPNSEISFNKLVRFEIENQNDNVTIKAKLLKKVFEY